MKSEPKPDTLLNTTVLRPADLVIGESGWTFTSIDMYTYRFSNGLYGYYGLQPDFMIDGIPTDINFFGWQSLNMLPLYLPGMRGVTATAKPIVYEHSLQPAGLLDFQNRRAETGLQVGGTVYLGNETGDPGPWIYDSSRVTPNVDRWGPDTGGLISYATDNWFARGTYVLRRHQQTDPLTHARLHRTMRALGGTRFYPIQTNSQSGMFETGYHSDRLRIRARGITAEDRNYVYLQPFGREVPAEVRYGQFALDTKYAVGSWNVGIRYIANRKELTKRNNDHSYVFDWSQLNNGIKGTAAYSGKALTLAGNVHYEDITTKAPGIQRKNDAITRLSLNLNLSEGAPNSFGFSSGIDIDHNKSAHSLRAVYRHKPTHYWSTQLKASYSETLPIDQQSFGYWITRGYNFYRELGIKLDPGLRVTKNRLLYYRLETTLKVHQHVTFLLNTDLTHHKRLNIPWQEISYDAQTGSSPGIFVISGEEGTRFGLETSASYQTNEWLRQGISFQMNRTLLGSSRYKNYFRQVPTIHMKYRVDVTPIESFALSFEGRYRSSTKWKEFDALDGREYEDIDNLFPVFTGIYHSTVPPQLDLEIGAQKGFWEQRLSLQVTIQNLLNREIRLHPFGADRALMFNIKAVAEF